jgi:hypothetical protein
MALTLLIPRSAAEERKYLKCFCGRAFPMDQRTQAFRHMGACAKRHSDEIEHEGKRREQNAFISPADKELHSHMKRGGK